MPRLSAIPKSVRPDSPIIRAIADQHGALQSNDAAIAEIEGALTGNPIIRRAAAQRFGVRTDAIVLADEPVAVEALAKDGRLALLARAFNERGKEVARATLQPSSDRQRAMVGPLEPEEYRQHATIGPLKPGAYRLVVGDLDPYRSRWLRSPRRSWCEM